MAGMVKREPLTDSEVDVLLERFDQTDPALQRRIVADTFSRLVESEDECGRLRGELERLQSKVIDLAFGLTPSDLPDVDHATVARVWERVKERIGRPDLPRLG
jgi:hypothetical protein